MGRKAVTIEEPAAEPVALRIEEGDEVRMTAGELAVSIAVLQGDGIRVNGPSGPTFARLPFPRAELAGFAASPLVVLSRAGMLWRWRQGKGSWAEPVPAFPVPKVTR